jgi:lipopolysaccharide transport system permease protein
LWAHRNLLRYLVLRDVRAALASTGLGALWLVVPPLATALLMVFVLGILVKVPTGGVPYSLVVLSGMTPWIYFSSTVSRATVSMASNAYLLTKVYFPRLIIPTVPVLACLIEFMVLLVIVCTVAVCFGYTSFSRWLALPAFAALTVVLAAAFSLWVSALNIVIRDVGNAMPVLLQALAYGSPVFYPHELIPQRWHWVYDLNPIVGLVDGFRWALIGGSSFPVYSLSVTLTVALLAGASGLVIFRVIEDMAADVV